MAVAVDAARVRLPVDARAPATHEPRAAAVADRVLLLADGLVVRDLGPCTTTEPLDALAELQP